MQTTRRGFLTGLGALLAAPAVVHAGNLMPISAKNLLAPPTILEIQTRGEDGVWRTFARSTGGGLKLVPTRLQPDAPVIERHSFIAIGDVSYHDPNTNHLWEIFNHIATENEQVVEMQISMGERCSLSLAMLSDPEKINLGKGHRIRWVSGNDTTRLVAQDRPGGDYIQVTHRSPGPVSETAKRQVASYWGRVQD